MLENTNDVIKLLEKYPYSSIGNLYERAGSLEKLAEILKSKFKIRTSIYRPMIIAVEGIDATGKGSLTRNLATFFNLINVSANRINVPNYQDRSGEIITQMLNKDTSEKELIDSIYEFANHFAVNRGFIKKDLNLLNNVIIFDRWINSSKAFSFAKILLRNGSNYLPENFGKLKPNDANDINDLNTYINDLEIGIMQNYKPDIEIILHTPMNEVEKRINERKIKEASSTDVHQNDAHEGKIGYLNLTQEVYKNLIFRNKDNQSLINTGMIHPDLKSNSERVLIEALDQILD